MNEPWGGRLLQRPGVVPLLLAGLTLAVYAQVLGHGFLTYDDRFFVTESKPVQAGLSLASLRWAFKSTTGFWFPLTRLSHLLDSTLWGLNPLGHHLTSLLLHLASVLLVFQVFAKLTGSRGRALALAALFAVHPLGAETVSWVSERKGVLCGTLFFAALWAYVPGEGPVSARRLAATTLLYLLALMAKPMAVTLPGVLLLLDAWPLKRLAVDGRVAWRPIVEKLPMVAVGVAVAAITVAAQGAVGAAVDDRTFPLSSRLANAATAAVEYLRQWVAPFGLSAFYPHPYDTLPAWQVAAAALGLGAVTCLLFLSRRARPHLLVGWLWWLGMLVPVIGLKQVGRWSMADHYMVLPMVGLTFAAVTELAGRLQPRAAAALAAAWVVGFAALAHRQAGYWRDTRTLMERTAEVTAGTNWMAELTLAELDAMAGDYGSAERRLRAAMAALERDRPMRARVWAMLLQVLDRLPGGRAAEVAFVEQRSRDAPHDALAQYDLGVARLAAQRWAEAEAAFRQVLALDPGYTPAEERLVEALKGARAGPGRPAPR